MGFGFVWQKQGKAEGRRLKCNKANTAVGDIRRRQGFGRQVCRCAEERR
jgi:hypothetical protein